jgi:hypothetical protein
MAPEEDDPRLVTSMLAGMLKGDMEYVTAWQWDKSNGLQSGHSIVA